MAINANPCSQASSFQPESLRTSMLCPSPCHVMAIPMSCRSHPHVMSCGHPHVGMVWVMEEATSVSSLWKAQLSFHQCCEGEYLMTAIYIYIYILSYKDSILSNLCFKI